MKQSLSEEKYSQEQKSEISPPLEEDRKKLIKLLYSMPEDAEQQQTIISEVQVLLESFTELGLSDNQLCDPGVCILAEALKNNRSITHLDLSYNQIGDKEVCVLAEVLRENSAITHLDLSDNRIGDKGAHALAEVLRENSAITHLSLPWSWPRARIGAEGWCALAEALKNNRFITHLSFPWGRIGAEEARALAEVLRENSSITHLSLAWNGVIAVRGIYILAEVLKDNCSITHLSLFWNRIIYADGAILILGKILKENPSITRLSFSWDKIGDKNIHALITLLKIHPFLLLENCHFPDNLPQFKTHPFPLLEDCCLPDNLSPEIKAAFNRALETNKNNRLAAQAEYKEQFHAIINEFTGFPVVLSSIVAGYSSTPKDLSQYISSLESLKTHIINQFLADSAWYKFRFFYLGSRDKQRAAAVVEAIKMANTKKAIEEILKNQKVQLDPSSSEAKPLSSDIVSTGGDSRFWQHNVISNKI